MRSRIRFAFIAAALCLPARPGARAQTPIKHVVLLTMDGAHALDLQHYVDSHPQSNLAGLYRNAVVFNNAHAPIPSDSFPTLMAMLTGGSPYSTGIWYESMYSRTLSPPGSRCATRGTAVVLDESIDKDPNALDGGGGIDPSKLVLDPRKGCTPVYPHQLLRVNTIFDVLKAKGLRTAFVDKQIGDEIDQGPTGHAIDDFYAVELHHAGASKSLPGIFHFDNLRNDAVINWIDGKDHTGTKAEPVPAIMGVTYQAVTVGEKLKPGMGWTDGGGTMSAPLVSAFDHTDMEIGRVVEALRQRGLSDSTVVIVTAKHGQSPIDVSKVIHIDPKVMIDAVNRVEPGLVAGSTGDDVYMFWLKDQSKTKAAVRALEAVEKPAHIRRILSGAALRLRYRDPRTDSRTPDIMIESQLGVIYSDPNDKGIAEHGGFSDEDTHVALMLSNPGWRARHVITPVTTMQLAPTIVKLLGADPSQLQAVRIEGTKLLPEVPGMRRK